jgi:hypothetical protein
LPRQGPRRGAPLPPRADRPHPCRRGAILPLFCPTDLDRAARTRTTLNDKPDWTLADQGGCDSDEPRRTVADAPHPAENRKVGGSIPSLPTTSPLVRLSQASVLPGVLGTDSGHCSAVVPNDSSYGLVLSARARTTRGNRIRSRVARARPRLGPDRWRSVGPGAAKQNWMQAKENSPCSPSSCCSAAHRPAASSVMSSRPATYRWISGRTAAP